MEVNKTKTKRQIYVVDISMITKICINEYKIKKTLNLLNYHVTQPFIISVNSSYIKMFEYLNLFIVLKYIIIFVLIWERLNGVSGEPATNNIMTSDQRNEDRKES